jgi:predicted phosphodiesterase
MKIVVISDIHGNFDALAALQETCDELWVLGDLVDAPYAVWEDGKIELKTFSYPVESAVAKVQTPSH